MKPEFLNLVLFSTMRVLVSMQDIGHRRKLLCFYFFFNFFFSLFFCFIQLHVRLCTASYSLILLYSLLYSFFFIFFYFRTFNNSNARDSRLASINIDLIRNHYECGTIRRTGPPFDLKVTLFDLSLSFSLLIVFH